MFRTLPLLLVACGSGFADPNREFGPPVDAEAPLYPVQVHQPKTLGVVDTPLSDVNGTPIGVGCDTCHGPEATSSFADDPDAPEEFHSGVELTHGPLTCGSCHDVGDRTQLHLADGTPVEFSAVITLCAQCHGVQYRDYEHGSHGGMNGYWDLRRGPRDRNHCVDCHAPHTPAYERVTPVFPPRDRSLDWGSHD